MAGRSKIDQAEQADAEAGREHQAVADGTRRTGTRDVHRIRVPVPAFG
jgi:hypothetical protein